jgi:hypothetical protein
MRATRLAPVAVAALSACATSLAAGALTPGIGYDVSFPQCGRALPTAPAFTIVGVNGGRPFTPNPCLGAGTVPSQLAWAGPGTAFYVNTANPGPGVTARWPLGQTAPQPCDTPSSPGDDTPGCAYDYGWNAGMDAYATAVAAYRSLGWAPAGATRTPTANVWWLDVERANSWRSDATLNVASLQGEVDALRSLGAANVGLYSVAGDWRTITGNTAAFAPLPSWVAGPSTQTAALALCGGPGFTGGGVALVQFPSGGFDGNVSCAPVAVAPLVAPVQAPPPRLGFAGTPPGMRAGAPRGLTIGMSAAQPVPVTVTLASDSPAGAFAVTPDGAWAPTLAVTIPPGATGVSVQYRDTRAGRPLLTATGTGVLATSVRGRVSPGPLARLVASPSRARLRRGAGQGFRASASDRYGNRVRTGARWSVSGGLGRLAPGVGRATRLTATRAGRGIVLARAHGLTVRVRVTVTPRP